MSIELAGLVAYPSDPSIIGITIHKALENLKKEGLFNDLNGWEENDIPGRFIGTSVMENIDGGTIFVADITRLNFNVVFEIGYAIGKKKRAFLIRNEAIKPELNLIKEVGIFDTLGYATYNDSLSLASLIKEISDTNPLIFDGRSINSKAPIYLLQPKVKGDVETHLIARIKKARLFFRSYDPEETGRLSALDAIENVVTSLGIVIPLLQQYLVDADIHNLRAAFVAGLSVGMEKPLLLLQSGDDPVPLDYRDLVNSFKFPEQIDEMVGDFATSVYADAQASSSLFVDKPSSLLGSIKLGASSAENEFRELGDYYLETDEYHSVSRGEVSVVLGRKGSGKTALFFQLRDRLRQDKQVVILDLKPEGFQLLKLKEQVLDLLEEGTREHTITAFWEYLLLLEICHKLLEGDQKTHLRDHTLFEPYKKLAVAYESDQYITEGDFSERMLKLTQRIVDDFIHNNSSFAPLNPEMGA